MDAMLAFVYRSDQVSTATARSTLGKSAAYCVEVSAMLSINWRSPAKYEHARYISLAGFAWEYLRRLEDYHRDFQNVARIKKPTARELEAFSQRWGLRFPVRS